MVEKVTFVALNIQAQPVASELVSKLLGNRVAVSPIVTIEPRRRKFHKPITLTIPVPKAAQKGMLNQYGGETPTLRLLCSIMGERHVIVETFSSILSAISWVDVLPLFRLDMFLIDGGDKFWLIILESIKDQ